MKKLLSFFCFLFVSTLIFSQSPNKYNVEIVRDSFGVPHIFGKTDADCAYGLVWAACEDDFNTVQWGLMVGKGMLGRYLGIDGAKIDYAVQLLRVRRTIEERYENDLSPEFKKLLQAAADAGNLYAKQHPDKVLIKATLPVQPEDFISGYMLSMALMTGVDGALSSVINGTVPQVSFADNGKGSNAMAMNSKITADGDVYLDVNSHQPLEGPMSWYEAHVQSEEGWNMLGATFHGAVTLLHGANENLGWAHTTNSFDAIDVFQLQPDPNKKNHYLVDGISYPLEVSKAKLVVNLAKNKEKNRLLIPVSKKIWWSKYGATVVTPRGIFAIRLASNMTIKAPEEWYRMDKAKSFTEFRHALDMQGLAIQNIAYADKYDTIFLISNGLMPKRAAGYDWTSTVPGNTLKTLWTEFLPVDSMAQVLNPPCGYVFNTNQTAYEMTCSDYNPKPSDINANIGYDKEEDNRSMRFYENISRYPKVSWNDFLKIKYDSHYPVKAKFLKPFRMFDIVELKESEHPDISDAIHIIKAWNQEASITDTNATLYIKVMYELYNASNDSMVKRYQKDEAARFDFFVRSIKRVKKEMLNDFGKLNVPLGDFQKLVRGNIVLGTDGGPDMWNAKYGHDYNKGKVRIWVGESYILLARFTKNGPVLRSVSPFGTSNTPGARHYTDQMQMYVSHQTKEESLSKEWAYKHAERIYHPGQK